MNSAEDKQLLGGLVIRKCQLIFDQICMISRAVAKIKLNEAKTGRGPVDRRHMHRRGKIFPKVVALRCSLVAYGWTHSKIQHKATASYCLMLATDLQIKMSTAFHKMK